MSYVQQRGLPARVRRRRALLLLALVCTLVLILVLAIAGLLLRKPDPGGTPATGAQPCPSASAEVPSPDTIVVNVYNSTNRTGLARNTAKDLGTHRFQVGEVGDDPLAASIADVAEIRYGPAGEQAAKVLATRVRGARLVADKRTGTSVDLVLGERFSVVSPRSTATDC
ncbi:LytR C-terminal domain-containing protein [Gephyromycinifex aptenodytis]|uniref:LytR C-terminal domain-containing protein n=1 Tax=Gephyromycinifex aptenodytis TaxID=2716227 RepID=UPI001445511C|nr:LytR C-terminal domain-containing protein [Gephyromycinifex aptenodytis]